MRIKFRLLSKSSLYRCAFAVLLKVRFFLCAEAKIFGIICKASNVHPQLTYSTSHFPIPLLPLNVYFCFQRLGPYLPLNELLYYLLIDFSTSFLFQVINQRVVELIWNTAEWFMNILCDTSKEVKTFADCSKTLSNISEACPLEIQTPMNDPYLLISVSV